VGQFLGYGPTTSLTSEPAASGFVFIIPIVRFRSLISAKRRDFFGHLRCGRRSREARTGLAAARAIPQGKSGMDGAGRRKENESGWMYLFVLV